MIRELLSHIDPTTLIGKVVLLAIVVTVASVIQRFVVRAARRALEKAEVPSASIFLNILRGLIWAFALLTVLQPVFGIEPTGFVAALGVTSVALSLGLQDTISNLIGGLSLMLTKVIVPGDHVLVGTFSGRVTDITWRTTTVKSRAGDVQVIPNSVLSKTAFTKLDEGTFAASSITMVVKRDADLEAVAAEAVVEAAKAAEKSLDLTRKPVARFSNMDPNGVTLTLTTFITPEASSAAVNDVVARALAGKPWLA